MSFKKVLSVSMYMVLWGSLLGVATGIFILWQGARFEDLRVLEAYEPALFTRVYDRNGDLIDIISAEKRIILEFEDIPPRFVEALVAVEDAHFFSHIGVSPLGIVAALKDYLIKDFRRGASTLTQQLVKNITKDKRLSIARKLKEQFLAVQLETRFTKQEIFAKYANEVALGNNQFGIEAAARYYFGKSVGALNTVECATLAGLPQAPSRYNPYRAPEACKERRNIVLERMREEGYLTRTEADQAKAHPLELVDRRKLKKHPSAAHFIDKVRQYLFEKYGEKTIRTSGWDVHTTLDLRYQQMAEKAVRDGLKEVDKRLGYRRYDCPSVFVGKQGEDPNILNTYYDPTWRQVWQGGANVRGVVIAVSPSEITVRVKDDFYRLNIEHMKWVSRRIKDMNAYFKVGDTPLFRVLENEALAERNYEQDEEDEIDGLEEIDGAQGENQDVALSLAEQRAPVTTTQRFLLELDQEPNIEAAFLVIDHSTGDMLAMVGGYDYRRSKFNRAEQAERQVGSAFKPVIFGAALEQGYRLSDILFDEPTLFADPTKFRLKEDGGIEFFTRNQNLARKIRLGLVEEPKPYQPHNYYNRYSGQVTLRMALARSLNIVSVKLLNSVGYDHVLEYTHRLKLGDYRFQPYPSLALGAMEMSLKDVVYTYGTFAKNGVRHEPRFITSIRDDRGRTIEKTEIKGEQVISPQNAFLVTHALTSVVSDPTGTARRARRLKLPLAGKTGTTNDYTDAWFVGFSSQLTGGVWVGRDLKHTIGKKSTGSNTALPIWLKFFEAIREELPVEHFPMPEGITRVPIDKYTGKKITHDCDCEEEGQFIEVYLKGTEPTDICSEEERKKIKLPWYLQKRHYEYDPETKQLKPAWVEINYASQQRGLKFLTER